MSLRFIPLCAITAFGAFIAATGIPASAQGTQAQQDACTNDAFRLCAELIPDPIRIEACLKSKRRSLSLACYREVFGDVPAKRERIVPVNRARQ